MPVASQPVLLIDLPGNVQCLPGYYAAAVTSLPPPQTWFLRSPPDARECEYLVGTCRGWRI